ncbi:MAG: ABC transporter permease, partial [Natronospirillum sp.]
MIRSTAFFIGCRYTLARKGNRFISITSLISIAGLILGVLALIIVLSVFNGSQGIMRDRTLITVRHGDISTRGDFPVWEQSRELLLSQPGIIGVAPYINTEAMISQRGYHQVAQVKGIDPALEISVSSVDRHMLEGAGLDDLRAGERKILLGRALANNLRLYPGDTM